MQVAFIYPGQGSQHAGMGRGVFEAFPEAREVFEAADTALPISISELCFEGSEEALRLTENTQPALLVTSLAVHRVLTSRGLQPGWVAGHSLGEYSAHVAAGSLELVDAVRLVNKRGSYMQAAVAPDVGAMAAILGLAAEAVEGLCEGWEGNGVVEVANLNAPAQTVVAGDRTAVEAVVETAKQEGARRAIMLNVSAPFHCSLMQPAADRLAVDLEAIEFEDPEATLVCNVDARPIPDGGAAPQKLVEQVTTTVRWSESVQFLASQGVEAFVEVGPGRVLSGLVKRTLGRDVQVHAVEEPEDIEKLIAAIAVAGEGI